MTKRRLLVLLAALFAVALCATPHMATTSIRLRTDRLLSVCPGLDPDLAHHVVADADREWIAYGKSIGVRGLYDALNSALSSLQTTSYPEFCARRRPLEGLCGRIALAFAGAFDFQAPLDSERLISGLSIERDFELRQLNRRHVEAFRDTTLSGEERLQVLEGVRARYAALGGVWWALRVHLTAAQVELELGRPERHRVRLAAALTESRRLGEHYLICQILGELGVAHWAASEEGSMRICFDEALLVARRHGFLEQAARVLRFDAAYYANRGRLALAADRLAEAQEVCASPGAGSARLRMQIEHAGFLARLGCWDLADRNLRRLPPLFREFPTTGRLPEAQKFALDAGRLRARLAFASGDPAQGDRRMRAHGAAMPPGYRRMGFAELYDEWSEGLTRNARFPEALEICERGLVHCDTAHVPERTFPLLVRRAELLHAMGRLIEADRSLDAVTMHLALHPSRDEGLVREVEILQARLLWGRGQIVRARSKLWSCAREFESRLRERESGVQSYLELEDALALRDAVHDLGGLSPEAGYRFECGWRSLSQAMGGARVATASPTLFAEDGGPPSKPPAGPYTHLVYHFTRDVLLRWTASPDGVVLDTLRVSSTACLADVREALALLQSEEPLAGAVLGPETRLKLRRLSGMLLPTSLLGRAGRPAVVYVSPDGPLSAFPFEALPAVGPRGEEPLAAWADVAYAHGWSRASARATRSAVIVSEPALSTDVRRRYAAAVSLPASRDEVAAAMARWPDAVLLRGEQATKSAALESWQGASHIYLAAHHVRDPDAPFLGFVPLAAPKGAPPDAALLEIADLRALDLSACRLAVLASCATGAPYRLALRPGPSLGEAFLDSGARAVVQSFWDVDDAETGEFMTRFLTRDAEDPDAATALGHARRTGMSTARGSSPRVWAAWSVHVSLPRRAGHGAYAPVAAAR